AERVHKSICNSVRDLVPRTPLSIKETITLAAPLEGRGQRSPVTFRGPARHLQVQAWLKAPNSKFVDGRSDPFCSVLTSVDLYCENRPHVSVRPFQYRPVVAGSRPFW